MATEELPPLPPGWKIVRPTLLGDAYLMARRTGGWVELFVSRPDEDGNWVSDKPVVDLHAGCLEVLQEMLKD